MCDDLQGIFTQPGCSHSYKTEIALPAWAIFSEPILIQPVSLTAQRASGVRGDPTFQLAFQAVGSKRLHQVI